MDRPERLGQAIEVNLLKLFFARMIGGETEVVGRMPILSGHDERKRGLQPIRQRNYCVPIRHWQGAAGQEIVLKVNKNQGTHGEISEV